MADYRVISTDLRTGTRIAELAVEGLTYSARLNSVGELGGTVYLPSLTSEAARIEAATVNDAVDEVRRQLVVERDGVVVWCGIVWASPYDDDSQTRSIKAAETWSYLRHRLIDWNANYRQVDQFAMARDIVGTALSAPGTDIGLSLGSEMSGRKRDRDYWHYERKQVGEAVEQLAAVIDGFDFAIEPSWDPQTGALIKRFTLATRRGRPYGETGHVFELGRNITSFRWPSDGTRAANKVHAVGAGEGDSMLIVAASDVAQLVPAASGGPGYPLLEELISNKDVSIPSTLVAQAQATVEARSRPVVLPELTVRADMDPVFGSYIVGDACRVVIAAGLTPRFPDGLDRYYRIVGWDVTVDDEGGEDVKLILGEEPGV